MRPEWFVYAHLEKVYRSQPTPDDTRQKICMFTLWFQYSKNCLIVKHYFPVFPINPSNIEHFHWQKRRRLFRGFFAHCVWVSTRTNRLVWTFFESLQIICRRVRTTGEKKSHLLYGFTQGENTKNGLKDDANVITKVIIILPRQYSIFSPWHLVNFQLWIMVPFSTQLCKNRRYRRTLLTPTGR